MLKLSLLFAAVPEAEEAEVAVLGAEPKMRAILLLLQKLRAWTKLRITWGLPRMMSATYRSPEPLVSVEELDSEAAFDMSLTLDAPLGPAVALLLLLLCLFSSSDMGDVGTDTWEEEKAQFSLAASDIPSCSSTWSRLTLPSFMLGVELPRWATEPGRGTCTSLLTRRRSEHISWSLLASPPEPRDSPPRSREANSPLKQDLALMEASCEAEQRMGSWHRMCWWTRVEMEATTEMALLKSTAS